MIGRTTVRKLVWEVWSDGHAYSDFNDHWKRASTGIWLPIWERKYCKPIESQDAWKDWEVYSEVSDALERVYTAYICGLIIDDKDLIEEK